MKMTPERFYQQIERLAASTARYAATGQAIYLSKDTANALTYYLNCNVANLVVDDSIPLGGFRLQPHPFRFTCLAANLKLS